MKLLIFANLLALAAQGADKMPTCVRPADFSMGKFVASYEACLNRQKKFCDSHKESKECAALPQKSGHPYFKVTVDDIDPTKRCKILPDGSYRCLQDPVRFIAPINNPPASGGGPQVASTPSTSTVPLEENPGGTADQSTSPAPSPGASPQATSPSGPGPLLHPPAPKR
ncbi:unnamed protein product [Sphagnum balticum]